MLGTHLWDERVLPCRAHNAKAPIYGALRGFCGLWRTLANLSLAESEGFEPSMRFWHILP
jgi:hypothetical protein